MELGIFSRTYEVSDLKETYERMTKDGIYHTQFNFSNAGIETLPNSITQEKIHEIQTLTEDYKITIHALTGTFNMIDPDTEARKKGIAQFKTQCELAKALHIPIVTLCTGSKNPKSKWLWHEDNLSEGSWTDLMKTTEIILGYAEEDSIILALETEASNIINTPARARKYLDQVGSPNLKIIMDGANLFRPDQVPRMREVLDEAFDLLSKDIVIAHAKDFSFDGQLSFVAAGQGMLDFQYYIELLKKAEYEGLLIMHGLSEEQISGSCQFLKELL